MTDSNENYNALMVYHDDLMNAYAKVMSGKNLNAFSDYFDENVLDVTVLCSFDKEYRNCELTIGYGNPNVYICTREQRIEYWNGGKKSEISLPSEVCTYIDDYVSEIYNT